MFKIRPGGTNMNDGLCIDEYITRKMVLAHLGNGQTITPEHFQELYEKLFRAALHKMLPPCK